MKDYSYEILVVDGLSTDDTIPKAKKAGAKIIIEKRKGKGIALRTGIKKSSGSIIAMLDGDGSYPPKYIPKMIELLKNCNVVVGSRLLGNQYIDSIEVYIHYRLFPFLAPWIYKKFKTSEPFTGMRVIRKSDWNKLNLKSKGFVIETEMEIKSIKNKFRIIEIPIPCIKRKGKSKYNTSFGQWIKMYKYIMKNKKTLEKDAKIYRIIDYSD